MSLFSGDPRYPIDTLRHEVYSRGPPDEREPPAGAGDYPHQDNSARSDISADSIERNGVYLLYFSSPPWQFHIFPNDWRKELQTFSD